MCFITFRQPKECVHVQAICEHAQACLCAIVRVVFANLRIKGIHVHKLLIWQLVDLTPCHPQLS